MSDKLEIRGEWKSAISMVQIDAVPRYDIEVENRVAISFNDVPFTWLAETMVNAIYATTAGRVAVPKPLVDFDTTVEYVLKAMKVALVARLVTLPGCGRLEGVSPKNFEYPSLLGPILARYGIVEKSSVGYKIVPVPGDQLVAELTTEGVLTKEGNGYKLSIPDWYPIVMNWLRMYNVMTTHSLPKDVYVTDEAIFQLGRRDDLVVGANPNAPADALLISVLTSAAMMTEIYGQYRVLYGAISAMRTAIESIALAALHKITNQE